MPGMGGEWGSRHGQREKVSDPMAGSAASMARVGVDLLLAEVLSLSRTPDGSLMDVGCQEGGSTLGRKLPATEGHLLPLSPVAEDVSLWPEVSFSGGIRSEAKGPFAQILWMLFRTLFSKAYDKKSKGLQRNPIVLK